MFRRSLFSALFAILCATAFAQAPSQSGPQPQEVTFPSGNVTLHAFLWKPEGKGPFPAVLWNHGSEKLPGWRPPLGRFYVQQGYVLFIPHRRGQGRSPGDYIEDLVAQAPPGARAGRMVELQESAVEDVVAALAWLKAQPFVDASRIAMSGCSYGGIQTLLAGERALGLKAIIPFAPGAISWDRNAPLQERLKLAVARAKAPVLVIQAENDFSLAPSRELSKEAQKRHTDFQAKVYPKFGKSHEDGHGGFCSTATDIWGKDVMDFLEMRMKEAQ